MRLVMTLMVRDEEDIIDATIRFHLAAGVDHLIVTDNRSVDGTTEILREYEAAGVLDYHEEAREDHPQVPVVTRMARSAFTDHHADWVINGDADEFWWPERGDLKSTLAAVPATTSALSIARFDFPPRPIPPQRDWSDEMVYRRSTSINELGTRLHPKCVHRGISDIRVHAGNHSISVDGERSEGEPTDTLVVLHFPARSFPQFERKTINIGSGYARQAGPATRGRSNRRRYERYLAGELRRDFDANLLTDEDVAAGMEAGDIVFDDRVRRALASTPPGAIGGR